MKMVKTTYKSSKDMINKLKSWKGKTKLNFYQNMSFCYDEMDIKKQKGIFQFEGDKFSKDAHGNKKIYQEVLFLVSFYRLNLNLKKWKLIIMI